MLYELICGIAECVGCMLIQGALRVSGPSEEGREESHGRGKAALSK